MSLDIGCPLEPEPEATPGVMQRMARRAIELGVPTTGHIDLTYRCNFRCAHCYVGHLVGRSQRDAGELGTEEVKALLSTVAEMGCLFVTLSGGEPLLRPDFSEIYTTARELGMIVSVYTNGSLVTDTHAMLFREYPPDRVDVSVYGVSEDTYRRVTGVAGAFGRVRRGIERLLEAGVRVEIKSMILKDNVEEIAAVENWAREQGLGYRVDPKLVPRIDGDPTPLSRGVDSKVAGDVEASLDSCREEFKMYGEMERSRPSLSAGGSADLYQCGAGRTSFHVDPQGVLRPCLLSRNLTYNVAEKEEFAESWRRMTQAVSRARWNGARGCLDCSDRVLCGYCAGLFEIEGASPENPPDYVCRLGRMRRELLDKIVQEEAHVENG